MADAVAEWARVEEHSALAQDEVEPFLEIEEMMFDVEDEPAEPAPEDQPNSAGTGLSLGDYFQSKPAILSESAERKVAAAFGELSEAFASRGKKTFDDLAEEMMRPMLQDWLDNNLPTLVERLVREEIERVARGPQ